jgi:very-short-patch-repair endonuclease
VTGRDESVALPPPSAGEGAPRRASGEGQRDGSGYEVRRDLSGSVAPLSRHLLTQRGPIGPPSPAEEGGRACGCPDSGTTQKGRRFDAPDPRLRAFAREQRQSYTRAEDAFWQQVRGGRFRGLKFRRQVPIPPYIADFLCASARVIVELDGEPHETEARRPRDAKRDAWLKGQGFTVLRFPNELVLSNLDLVLDRVGEAIAARSGHGTSLPPLRGRVPCGAGRERGATVQEEAAPVRQASPCPEPASPLPTPADAGEAHRATLPRRGRREIHGAGHALSGEDAPVRHPPHGSPVP